MDGLLGNERGIQGSRVLAYPLRGSVTPFMGLENSRKVPWGGHGEDDRFGFAHVGCKAP